MAACWSLDICDLGLLWCKSVQQLAKQAKDFGFSIGGREGLCSMVGRSLASLQKFVSFSANHLGSPNWSLWPNSVKTRNFYAIKSLCSSSHQQWTPWLSHLHRRLGLAMSFQVLLGWLGICSRLALCLVESWQTQQQTLPPRHIWFVGMAVVVALCGSNKERHRDGFHLGSFLQGNKPHGSQPGGSNGHGMHCVGWCLAHPGPILFGHIVAKAFNVLACNGCLQVARASQVYLVNGILDCFLQIIGQAGLVKLLQDLDDGGACPFLGCLQLGTQGCGQCLHQLAFWMAMGTLFQMA